MLIGLIVDELNLIEPSNAEQLDQSENENDEEYDATNKKVQWNLFGKLWEVVGHLIQLTF
jgi:hypothetical protein